MKVVKTALPGLLILEPVVWGDERGFFLESWNERVFQEAGITCKFVQDNHSRSQKGVLRGLHYQLPQPQAKLVRVTRGEVFDVAVDIRKGSPTYGNIECAVLSEDNKKMLFIPEGFAHGFYTISEVAELQYKCSDFYNPQAEHTLFWNDPSLDIPWPLESGDPVLSKKDIAGIRLADIKRENLPLYGGE
jgi:dTDP-4-dehydrorhamnose 3,5-epimerase